MTSGSVQAMLCGSAQAERTTKRPRPAHAVDHRDAAAHPLVVEHLAAAGLEDPDRPARLLRDAKPQDVAIAAGLPAKEDRGLGAGLDLERLRLICAEAERERQRRKRERGQNTLELEHQAQVLHKAGGELADAFDELLGRDPAPAVGLDQILDGVLVSHRLLHDRSRS